jgi:hypothetical protein
MPAEVALQPLYQVLKALLGAYAPLTAQLGTKPAAQGGGPAIYDDGSPGLDAYTGVAGWSPYVTLGAGTQVPFHAMGGGFGWNCTVQIKPAGQVREDQGLLILSAVITCLTPGRDLIVPGYTSAWIDEVVVQPTIVTQQAGVTTREWPAIQRVFLS